MQTEALAAEWMEAVCRVETTTGAEDAGLDQVLKLVDSLGAKVQTQKVQEGRHNVLATWGRPRVLLSSHFDTVPPYVPFRFDGETFWGRGVCDAKGQWIAQLLAIRELLAEGVTDLAWLGVVGEETGSEGAREAKRLAPELPNVSLVINGEPTECKLATGQRGTARYLLSCQGVSTHSGMPELGVHAIWMLMEWLERLKREALNEHPLLGPEIWNLGVIRGGTATNVIPAEAEAEIMLRLVPDSKFEAALDRTKPEKGTWKLSSYTEPCLFASLPGFETVIVPYGSDAPHLRFLAKDERVILAGPGTIKVAHRNDERLSMANLMAGVKLFKELALAELK